MKYEIKNRWTDDIIYSIESDSWVEVIKAARASGADLRSANLRSADLSGARLSGADLRYADLSGADLSGARLSSARLSGADLRSADLSGARLSGADLSGADLRYANLSGADLSGADLSGADLRSANLRSADLSGADLPAPTMVLLAIWGKLSNQLTADLMLFDASAHPDPMAFQRWAVGGSCPYDGVKVQRVANFNESKRLWGTGKLDTIYNLMMRVLKEKTKQNS